MIKEQEEFIKSVKRKTPEFKNPEEALAWREEQVRLANEARQAQAEADYNNAIDEFIGDLSATAEDKEMMSEVNMKCFGIPNADIRVSTNDLVIRTLNLDTEEGILELFEKVGINHEGIQNLMSQENVSTLEELAKCKKSIRKIGRY